MYPLPVNFELSHLLSSTRYDDTEENWLDDYLPVYFLGSNTELKLVS